MLIPGLKILELKFNKVITFLIYRYLYSGQITILTSFEHWKSKTILTKIRSKKAKRHEAAYDQQHAEIDEEISHPE